MKLTLEQLRAVEEALNFRLAGDLDDTDINAKAYTAAVRKVGDEIARRAAVQRARLQSAFKPETLRLGREFLQQWEEMRATGRMNVSRAQWLALKLSLDTPSIVTKLMAALDGPR